MSPRKRSPGPTQFSRILVDIDALAGEHPALDQAVDLAARSKGLVTVVDVVEDVPDLARAYVSDRLEEDIVASRRRALDAVAARYRRRKVRMAVRVLRGAPATAVVRHAIATRADLVVRSHGRDLVARRRTFGSVDMQLLRKCPCPVWVVGVGERSSPKRILAAIHPDPDDAVEQALNHRILDAARALADLQKGTLTVLTAWAPYGEPLLRSHMSPKELREFVAAARAAARETLDDFLEEHGPLGRRAKVEFAKGEPDEVIPRFARRHDIDLVVMGTVARKGLAGLLMGNTAEHMLQKLQCSVFALKPAGFKSPVEA